MLSSRRHDYRSEVMQMSMAGAPDSKMEDYISVITNKTAILLPPPRQVPVARHPIAFQAMHDYGLAWPCLSDL